ncbi:PIN domain-containing protein [Inhella proteolytica]|uniref:PIN domain-containing protein n=1 Tax=Inhella proteolytica TaxID=2795029 RepID=A0A931NFP3_9BURK|nr:PIN domain-containing protein [Inhella proteolytica]MBH9579017.1 PIN domain-containing protein [Inhella proteolytica]
MTQLVFVDTNVLLYAFDDKDPVKRDAARQWLVHCWSLRCGRVSTQVLHEFYWNARKKFPTALSAGDARAEVRRYQLWQPWLVDHATVESAWAVESRWGLNYWDALMVAAAQQQGCELLLTEDLQHDQQIDSLRIVNPFKTGPETLHA